MTERQMAAYALIDKLEALIKDIQSKPLDRASICAAANKRYIYNHTEENIKRRMETDVRRLMSTLQERLPW